MAHFNAPWQAVHRTNGGVAAVVWESQCHNCGSTVQVAGHLSKRFVANIRPTCRPCMALEAAALRAEKLEQDIQTILAAGRSIRDAKRRAKAQKGIC